jgi:hypothetical protein
VQGDDTAQVSSSSRHLKSNSRTTSNLLNVLEDKHKTKLTHGVFKQRYISSPYIVYYCLHKLEMSFTV